MAQKIISQKDAKGTTIKVFVIDNDGKRRTVQAHAKKVNKEAKKGLKGSQAARSVALAFMSDFISKQGGFRPATKAGVFEKASARPDIQGSVALFKKVLGVDLAPTEIKGGAEAFLELKQRTSTRSKTTVTQRQITRDSKEEMQLMKGFGITGRDTVVRKGKEVDTFLGVKINQLSKDQPLMHEVVREVPGLKKSLIDQMKEKFENYTIIDYLDKTKKGQPGVKILPNAAEVLNFKGNFEQAVFLEAEQSRNTAGQVNIVISAKLNPSYMAKFEDKVIDITEKFHANLGKNFSTRFLKYAADRFTKGSRLGTGEFLEAVIGLAKEFETGANTPLIYQTIITAQKMGKSSTTLALSKQTQQKTKQQKFISGAQLSALVQKKMGQIMPKGPRRGPPLSPNVLTERTGEFRRSTRVIPNYRKNMMRYFYSPKYYSHQSTDRNPDELIEKSIKEIVTGLFSRQFKIVRGI